MRFTNIFRIWHPHLQITCGYTKLRHRKGVSCSFLKISFSAVRVKIRKQGENLYNAVRKWGKSLCGTQKDEQAPDRVSNVHYNCRISAARACLQSDCAKSERDEENSWSEARVLILLCYCLGSECKAGSSNTQNRRVAQNNVRQIIILHRLDWDLSFCISNNSNN